MDVNPDFRDLFELLNRLEVVIYRSRLTGRLRLRSGGAQELED